jgi:hypothetical protein
VNGHGCGNDRDRALQKGTDSIPGNRDSPEKRTMEQEEPDNVTEQTKASDNDHQFRVADLCEETANLEYVLSSATHATYLGHR